MATKPSSSVTVDFTTQTPSTGAATDADTLPAGTLVVNGTDNGATVTVTNKETGVYKAAVTIPDLTAGDEVQIRIDATVGGVAGKAVVWTDHVDTKLNANLQDLTAAQVNAQADTALADYDPPTKTEMDTAFTEIKGGTWDSGTDTLEDIRNATAGAGAGLPTATITVTETDDDGDPIPSARVQIYDSGNSVYVAEGTTNGSGVAAIIVPGDATYKARVSKPGWTFTVPETLTVSGDTADAYYGTQFTPGTPSPGTVRIYSWEFEADGATAIPSVAVNAWPSNRGAHHDDGGIAYEDTYNATATTDSNGYWYLDLTPDTEYDFDLQTTRDNIYRKITTPAANSQLEDIDGIDD